LRDFNNLKRILLPLIVKQSAHVFLQYDHVQRVNTLSNQRKVLNETLSDQSIGSPKYSVYYLSLNFIILVDSEVNQLLVIVFKVIGNTLYKLLLIKRSE
jgi:hypothetical protein